MYVYGGSRSVMDIEKNHEVGNKNGYVKKKKEEENIF